MDDTELKLGCAGMVIFCIIIAIIGYISGPVSCDAKFNGANVAHKWTLLGGCQVNDPKQGWVPAENFRVI